MVKYNTKFGQSFTDFCEVVILFVKHAISFNVSSALCSKGNYETQDFEKMKDDRKRGKQNNESLMLRNKLIEQNISYSHSNPMQMECSQ